jgi:hypothetical protein
VRAAVPFVALLLTAACAAAGGGPAPSTRAADFSATQVRQPAVFVRLELAAGQFDDREAGALPDEYEGALLEALDARAIPARDVRRVTGRAHDAAAALARAREVGADHAILVDVRVERAQGVFCRDGRRPFRAAATVWRQAVEVLRASDGARRAALSPARLTVTDVEPDCDDPRASRRRTAGETVREAVNRLLERLLDS